MPDPLGFLFFDQPAPSFLRWAECRGNLGNSLLYDPAFRARLEADSPVPFARQLLALIEDVGADTAALRCRFYAAYAAAIHEGFLRPLRRFCRQHGLALTGHEILPHVASFALNGGFTSVDPRVAPAVDFFGLDAWRDETAVDANNLAPQLSPALGASLAQAAGRRGCLAELYFTATRTGIRAAGMWELTPAALRGQMIRLTLLGARRIILHALYQNDGQDGDAAILSNLRFDFPPGLNFEPWWPHLGGVVRETARLSAFCDVPPPRQVAIFYPLHCAFAEGPRHAHARHFGAWCEGLHAAGTRFSVIDEGGLGRAQVSGDGVTIDGVEIAALILPAVTLFGRQSAAADIARMQAAGCPLWLSGPVATAACDGPIRLSPDRSLARAAGPGRPSCACCAACRCRAPRCGPRRRCAATLRGAMPRAGGGLSSSTTSRGRRRRWCRWATGCAMRSCRPRPAA